MKTECRLSRHKNWWRRQVVTRENYRNEENLQKVLKKIQIVMHLDLVTYLVKYYK